MSDQFILQIGTSIVTAIIAIFTIYLSQRAKNTAQKEDLHALTKEVESVKDKFIREQEFLKSELQKILSNEISYRDEERNAIINFHGLISEWIYYIRGISFLKYNESNFHEIDSFIDQTSVYYTKTGVSKAKVELLVDDQELVKLSIELFYIVNKYHHNINIIAANIKYDLKRINVYSEGISNIEDSYETVKEILEKNPNNNELEVKNTLIEIKKNQGGQLEKYKTEKRDLLLEIKKYQEKSYEMSNSHFDLVIPTNKDFKDLVKEYLKK